MIYFREIIMSYVINVSNLHRSSKEHSVLLKGFCIVSMMQNFDILQRLVVSKLMLTMQFSENLAKSRAPTASRYANESCLFFLCKLSLANKDIMDTLRGVG